MVSGKYAVPFQVEGARKVANVFSDSRADDDRRLALSGAALYVRSEH